MLLSAPIDWLEDALLLALLGAFPAENALLAQLASVTTMAKLGILHGALALIPIALIAWATSAWAARPRAGVQPRG